MTIVTIHGSGYESHKCSPLNSNYMYAQLNPLARSQSAPTLSDQRGDMKTVKYK